MESESSSQALINVKTLIETAFGEKEINRVNFKLIEAVLFIISRQLKILDQRVHIACDTFMRCAPETVLSVTELRMHTKKKRKTSPPQKPGGVAVHRASVDPKSRSGKKGRKSEDLDRTSRYDDDDTPEGQRKSRKSRQEEDDEIVPHKGARKSVSKHRAPKALVGDAKTATARGDGSDIDSQESEIRSTIGDKQRRKTKDEDKHRGVKKSVSVQGVTESPSTSKKGGHDTSNQKAKEVEMTEEQREKELRIISQRADSQEEGDPNPQPMATVSELEVQQEKILLVERVSSKDMGTNQDRPRQLSIVTLDQFQELVEQVRDLEARFGDINVPGFPENEQLMRDLRKSASLTDAMGALQLSARLEASEKTLEKMINIVTVLAKTTPEDDAMKAEGTEPGDRGSKEPGADDTKITKGDLEKAMDDLHAQILVEMNNTSSRAKTNADAALMTATKLEEKLDIALELEDRMDDLESLVADYTERITTMDTGVSSQMSAYQEQLTQMQYELEAGMDAMAESLANTGGDPAAVAELNSRLNFLQIDMENTSYSQNELKSMQAQFNIDLETLYRQMETINVMKCDRDEVTDALKDKAGLSDLNGRVKESEFEAVRGDIEKRIQAAYNKFNSQELVWQKLIDELAREINQKVDYNQLFALREEMNKYLNVLNDKYLELAAIVGEPRSSTISRRLIRSGICLSCSTPAQLTEETIMTRHNKGDGMEDPPFPNESGDRKRCCFGQPIRHDIDPRAFSCQRYCGGRHTVSTTADLIAAGAVATGIQRPQATGVGSDGKVYAVDPPEMVPCEPCNRPPCDTCQECKAPPYAKTNMQCFAASVNQNSVSFADGSPDPSDLLLRSMDST